MEVTKGNFPGVLQEVQFLLTRSSLVAFDCEFTGLRSSGVREAWEDTPDERYCKLKRGSSEFALIQYGVCFFVQDDTSNLKFEAHPFNFYLFPSYPLGRRIPKRLDRRFCCQASSLVMLASFGLDFNKWIREGVPYLRESDELWWKEGRSKAGEPSQDELNQFIGFSQVFKMIVESKIPLVGHSILLDLLHSYTHFIDDLPEALMTFKEELHKRLSSLYDTQLICENDKIRVRCFW
jgi:poly(A)-specific ribonuclease